MDRILDKTIVFIRNNDGLDEECVIVRYGLELLLLKFIFTTVILLIGPYTLGYSQISCSVMLALILTAVLMGIEYIRNKLRMIS